MITLESMLKQSQDFDLEKSDFNTREDSPMRFDGGKAFLPQATGQAANVGPFDVTDHALGQLCGRLGPATFGKGSAKMLPFDAMRAWIDNPTFAQQASALLNANIGESKKPYLVRTYDKDVRAVLSDRYAVIDNTEILTKLHEAVGLLQKQAGRDVVPEIIRGSVTPDDLYMRLRFKGTDVLPPGESGPYGIGIFLQNGETGLHRLKALPCLWRGACDNTLVIDSANEAAIDVRHYGNQGVLADRVAEAIGHGLKLGREYLNQLILSRQVEIPDIFGVISKMAESEGWSTQFTDTVRTGTEGERNLYGMINGLTWAAKEALADKPVEMAEMEIRAGRMLTNPPTWIVSGGTPRPTVVEN